MKINYSIIGFLSLLPVVMLITSCESSRRKTSEETEVVYEASTLSKRNVSGVLVLPGELEGYYETGIMAKVNGYVKRILVDIGDKVSQGQLLVELEAPELMSQLDASYAELQVKEAIYWNTKGKYSRLHQTNKTPGAVSPYDMDFAKTAIISDSLTFVAAKSRYQSIKNLTDYLKIIAPFEGLITERTLAPGAFVGPGDKNLLPILKLKNESRLRLHLAVPEMHIAEIKLNDGVQFSVRSYPEKSFEGKITRIAKTINTQTRSEMVEIEIENKAGLLLPGMFAQATIPIQRSESSFVVPQSSVVINMERSFVIKVSGGDKAVLVDVQKGEAQGNQVEIFGHLVLGDTILNEGSDEIRAGENLKVIVVEAKKSK